MLPGGVGGSLSNGRVRCALLIALAGCGGATTTHAVGGSVAACPSDSPGAQRLRASDQLGGRLVPADPVSAQICAYALISPAGRASPMRRVVLDAATARTLALLLDQATPLRSRPPRCTPRLLNDVIALSYRNATVEVAVQDCAAPEGVAVSAGGRSWVLGDATTEAIEGATLTLDEGTVRTPSFIGLPFVPAVRAGRAFAGNDGAAIDELQDAQRPFGTVVWQEPLPGVPQSRTAGVDLLVAVGLDLPCRAGQLAGRYRQGGVGTGDQFGSIVLFDTSSRPCSLSGSVTLTGLDARGRPATVAATGPLEPPLTLSPRATAADLEKRPVAVLAASVGFGADVRDDPAAPDGLCYSHETYPAAWSVALEGQPAVRVVNGGPGAGGRFSTCHRRLSLGLGIGFQLIQ